MEDLALVDGDTKLADLEATKGDMVVEYWSPDEGAKVRAVFLGIESHSVQDFNDPRKLKQMECVVLAFEFGDTYRRMINGSKRLVAVFQEHDIPENTAFEITYFGREKNSTNNNASGRWSVVPLQRKAEK